MALNNNQQQFQQALQQMQSLMSLLNAGALINSKMTETLYNNKLSMLLHNKVISCGISDDVINRIIDNDYGDNLASTAKLVEILSNKQYDNFFVVLYFFGLLREKSHFLFNSLAEALLCNSAALSNSIDNELVTWFNTTNETERNETAKIISSLPYVNFSCDHDEYISEFATTLIAFFSYFPKFTAEIKKYLTKNYFNFEFVISALIIQYARRYTRNETLGPIKLIDLEDENGFFSKKISDFFNDPYSFNDNPKLSKEDILLTTASAALSFGSKFNLHNHMDPKKFVEYLETLSTTRVYFKNIMQSALCVYINHIDRDCLENEEYDSKIEEVEKLIKIYKENSSSNNVNKQIYYDIFSEYIAHRSWIDGLISIFMKNVDISKYKDIICITAAGRKYYDAVTAKIDLSKDDPIDVKNKLKYIGGIDEQYLYLMKNGANVDFFDKYIGSGYVSQYLLDLAKKYRPEEYVSFVKLKLNKYMNRSLPKELKDLQKAGLISNIKVDFDVETEDMDAIALYLTLDD